MQTVTTIGLDIARSVFQVHGVDAAGKVVIRRKLKRRYVLVFFQKLPPCLVPPAGLLTGVLRTRNARGELSSVMARSSHSPAAVTVKRQPRGPPPRQTVWTDTKTAAPCTQLG
jgi:hypothetical protein